jgi:hypothetical protein
MTDDLRGVSAGAHRKETDSGYRDISTRRTGMKQSAPGNNVTGRGNKEAGIGRSNHQFGGIV